MAYSSRRACSLSMCASRLAMYIVLRCGAPRVELERYEGNRKLRREIELTARKGRK